MRDASYGDLCTALRKAVARGQPLAVQLLVCVLRRRGMLWETMWARDALGRTPLESARAYASMPPNEAQTEGVWVWRWDAAAGEAGADWATCLRLLERAVNSANVACDGAALTAALSTTTTTTAMNVVGIPPPSGGGGGNLPPPRTAMAARAAVLSKGSGEV